MVKGTSLPSDIDWLGDIPNHWDMRRLKYIVEFRGGGTPSKDEERFWGGDIPWVSPKDMRASLIVDSEDHITEEAVRASSTRQVPTGSVLVVVRSGILRHSIPVAIAGRPVTLNQDMKALIPRVGVESRYLRYVILGRQHALLLAWRKAGATVASIEHDLLANTVFPVPPYGEQQLIADFLDEKTAAIDALIAKKERLIDLIEEKRQAAITRAVTKGLDPDVPMKDSGVEWLGEVPDHWQVTRLKFGLQRIEQGWSPACENRPAAEDEWGVMRAGCVNGSEFNPNDNKALPAGVEPLSEYEIRPGDVLMSRANTRALLGSAAMVGAVRPRLILCDKLYRLTPRKTRLVPEFLVFVLSAWPARYQLERDATGASSSMQNIGQDTVLNLVLPVPSVAEQRQIAGATQKQNRSYQESKRHLQNSIIRLQEYRQTLISAAVTGQIDIRSRSTRADRVLEEALA